MRTHTEDSSGEAGARGAAENAENAEIGLGYDDVVVDLRRRCVSNCTLSRVTYLLPGAEAGGIGDNVSKKVGGALRSAQFAHPMCNSKLAVFGPAINSFHSMKWVAADKRWTRPMM